MKIAICILIALGAPLARADTNLDKPAVEALVRSFMDAWDRHDAHAVASLFVEDADFTNLRGTHVHGRAAVEKFLADGLKNRHLTGQLRNVRFLKPDVAIVDIDWEMTGLTASTGVSELHLKGLLDWVLTKAHGRWFITVMHNAELMSVAVPTPGK